MTLTQPFRIASTLVAAFMLHGILASTPVIQADDTGRRGEVATAAQTPVIRTTKNPKQWHKFTLDIMGPSATEVDGDFNPFTDVDLQVRFSHPDSRDYVVPGFFAADGNAGETSATSGNVWRTNFAPDQTGTWTFTISMRRGKNCVVDDDAASQPVSPYDGKTGTFSVLSSDKSGRDLRGRGRLQYVGKRYLQFAGDKTYFLKGGADAPETLLGYEDFDGTVANKSQKVPLKSFTKHVGDWTNDDPSWQNGKGKGLIGAINYLSGKGCNAFSFLTYNAGGDGDNVWPMVSRNDKLHYDCSKLDQWSTVFDHGTAKGMYLHFKLQETENDDNRRGTQQKEANIPTALDGGDLGIERKLYLREMIARFGHNLALNWNLGEENTQSHEQQIAMMDYIAKLDAYDHAIVLHTYPQQQDQIYKPLLGENNLTGLSLQNSSLGATHPQTVKWVKLSEDAGKPWIVAFDESGSAAHAQCPDLGYQATPESKPFDGHDVSGKMAHTQHEVRKETLWGTLMAGGAGNEYYFGYKFEENDLVCEDWRSRDQSWDYIRIALGFFDENQIPFWDMANADELVGNPKHDNSRYCFAKPGEVYLVYLPSGGQASVDLSGCDGTFNVSWFNPREGGDLQTGAVTTVQGGAKADLGTAPSPSDEDWLAVIRR